MHRGSEKMKIGRVLLGAAVLALAAGPSLAAEGTLIIGLKAEPSAIDPHYHNLGPNNSMATHIFSRLIEQDAKQRLMPGLALSWKAINETTWEFKLRKGVTFTDGSAFDADDVIFTAKRAELQGVIGLQQREG